MTHETKKPKHQHPTPAADQLAILRAMLTRQDLQRLARLGDRWGMTRKQVLQTMIEDSYLRVFQTRRV